MVVALVVIVLVLVCVLALAAGAALRARRERPAAVAAEPGRRREPGGGSPGRAEPGRAGPDRGERDGAERDAAEPDRAERDGAEPDRAGSAGGFPAEVDYPTELAASLEPAEVLRRALEAAVALPGVDGALITLGAEAERMTVATGLSDEEIERAALPLPAHTDLRAIEVSYHHHADSVAAGARPPRSGLVLALRADGETIGALAALSRSNGAGLPAASAQQLDALAHRAGPAIANARRYSHARELAELDSLTGLHNRRLFYDFLGREIARGLRYERFLSLIVFDLDDFKRINDRLGHLGGDAVLAEVADRVRGVVRATDIACRVGGDEFAIILPESSREDAELLADRIARAIATQPIDKAGPLGISAGVAELRREDTAADLFKRADQAMYRAKHAGKARTVAH